MSLLTKTIKHTGKSHTATVFFFHGSGDTGSNLIEWVRFLLNADMAFDHINVVYPTAPLQPYTPNGGEPSNVWFDRKAIEPSAPEARDSLNAIYARVAQLIDAEVAAGIPLQRIAVGGFSMGGALALHTAYHLRPQLRACFALSAFLNDGSVVYDTLRQAKTTTTGDTTTKPADLLMMHGQRDRLVLPSWGESTFEALHQLGVPGAWHTVRNASHELKLDEMQLVQRWLLQMLPPSAAAAPEQTPANKL